MQRIADRLVKFAAQQCICRDESPVSRRQILEIEGQSQSFDVDDVFQRDCADRCLNFRFQHRPCGCAVETLK